MSTAHWAGKSPEVGLVLDGTRTPTASTLEVWTEIGLSISITVLAVPMLDRCLLETSRVAAQKEGHCIEKEL